MQHQGSIESKANEATQPAPVNGSNEEKVPSRKSSVDILSELDESEFKAASDAAASTGLPSSAATTDPTTLKPEVLTASDLAEQQRTARASEEIVRASAADPYASPANVDRLKAEYESLQAQVDGFAKDKTR